MKLLLPQPTMGKRLLRVASSQVIKCSSILCQSVFLVFKKTPVSYFQTRASLGVQENTNGDREKVDQRQEKDWNTIISREYATDHTEMVTYLEILLVRHTKFPAGILFPIPSSFFHQNSFVLCVQTAQHAVPVFLHWLTPPSLLTHKRSFLPHWIKYG